MKFKQLSLFIENQPAHVRRPCEVLAAAGINIRTLCLADAEKYGVLRLIVDDTDAAIAALTEAQCTVKCTDVLAIQVADRPGGLAELLAVIDEAGCNIAYMYAFTQPHADKAILFFRFDDTDEALAALQERGVAVLDPVDLK